jgi:hypothetical protein
MIHPTVQYFTVLVRIAFFALHIPLRESSQHTVSEQAGAGYIAIKS